MAVYSLAGRVQKAGARVSHSRAPATSEAIVEAAQPAGQLVHGRILQVDALEKRKGLQGPLPKPQGHH